MEIQIPLAYQSGNTPKKKKAELSKTSLSKRIVFLIFVIIKITSDSYKKSRKWKKPRQVLKIKLKSPNI